MTASIAGVGWGAAAALLAGTSVWALILRRGVGRAFPSYLVKGRLPDGPAVPVMMYHAVTAERLDAELSYLQSNGYETISAETLAAWLRGEGRSLPPRPIALTFDDGHASLYSVAYGLLNKYGMQATAFVCPWWVEQASRRRRGEADAGIPVAHVTWDELREMSASGGIDVESHTYDHHRVWIDSEVIGFVTPDGEWPGVRWDDERAPSGYPRPPLGWPILRYGPRFGPRPAFIPDVQAVGACVRHVADNGGADFFSRRDWREGLLDLLGGVRGHAPGRFETAVEQREAMSNDLQATREAIERELGKPIRHLCFPWNEAGELAVGMAIECGYHSIFRGTLDGRDVNVPGGDPMHILRINAGSSSERYTMSLPGRGRRGVSRVLLAKSMAVVMRRVGARNRA